MSDPRSAEDWAAVESLEDFARYLMLLRDHFTRDASAVTALEARGAQHVEGEWRHPNVGDYFEAWAAWLSDRYLGPAARGDRAEVEPVSWANVAFQLWQARVYE